MPFPDIDPIAISLGPIAIRWYAIAYLGGILLGWALLRYVTRAEDDPVGQAPLDSLINAGVIGIIIGGRLGYVLGYNFTYFMMNPLEILMVWQGGMSFHGGFVGMIGAVLWAARRYRIHWLALGDLIVFAAPIGLFFGRIANFINGELFGRITDVPWGVVFPNGGTEPRHPSQLYEAALEGIVLFLILFVVWRCGGRDRRGLMTGIFFTGYGIARIFVEFFRAPDAHIGFVVAGLTTGQLLSLPMVLIGFYLMATAKSVSASK